MTILLVGGAIGAGSVLAPRATPSASPEATPRTSGPDPSARSGSWVVTGGLHVPVDRGDVAVRLADGTVLLLGGENNDGPEDPASRNAEIFDPDRGQWTVTAPMLQAHRSGQSATLLADGRVLVAGGSAYQVGGAGPSARDEAEVYDPTTRAWTATGTMTAPRNAHLATLLPNGSVLVVGAWTTRLNPALSAEIYAPATGSWSRIASPSDLATARGIAMLPDGRVLVVGVRDASRVGQVARVYDPASGTWAAVAAPSGDRCGGGMFALPDGRVVLLCGTVYDTETPSAHVFDPAIGTWTELAAPSRRIVRAVLLMDGRVLVADTGVGALLDPSSGTWTPAGLPAYPAADAQHLPLSGGDEGSFYEPDTATALTDGTVLLSIRAASLIFDPGRAP